MKIEITSKISEKKYIKVLMQAKKVRAIKVILLGLLMLPVFIWLLGTEISSLAIGLVALFYLIMISMLITDINFFIAKKQFRSNKAIQQQIIYSFTREGILIESENFNSRIE